MPPRVIGSFCILGTAPLLRWGKWGICPGQAIYRGAKSLIPAPLAPMQVSELHRAWAHADPAARCPLLKLFKRSNKCKSMQAAATLPEECVSPRLWARCSCCQTPRPTNQVLLKSPHCLPLPSRVQGTGAKEED